MQNPGTNRKHSSNPNEAYIYLGRVQTDNVQSEANRYSADHRKHSQKSRNRVSIPANRNNRENQKC